MEHRIELERRGKAPAQVKDLNLDNTRATQIEGLTDEYTALESLSMINVGLTSLKGFPNLPQLKRLELSDNRVSTGFSVLKGCPNLVNLNISGNKVKDLDALEPLKTLEHLTHLDLFNNPLTSEEDDFRAKVFKMLPSLKYLDGVDINNEEDEDDEEDLEQNGGADGDGGGEDGDEDDVEDEEGEDEGGEDGEGGEEEESEGDDEEDDEEDDGPGLAAIYNDNLENEEDEEDFDGEGEEEDDDELEDEEEEDESEPRGKRRKVDEEDADGDA